MSIDRQERQRQARVALVKLGFNEASDALPNMSEINLRQVRGQLHHLLTMAAAEHHADIEAALDALGLYWAAG